MAPVRLSGSGYAALGSDVNGGRRFGAALATATHARRHPPGGLASDVRICAPADHQKP